MAFSATISFNITSILAREEGTTAKMMVPISSWWGKPFSNNVNLLPTVFCRECTRQTRRTSRVQLFVHKVAGSTKLSWNVCAMVCLVVFGFARHLHFSLSWLWTLECSFSHSNGQNIKNIFKKNEIFQLFVRFFLNTTCFFCHCKIV